MSLTYKERYSFEQRVSKVKNYAESESDKILIIV